MSFNLIVASQINPDNLVQVTDQDANASSLYLAGQGAQVSGVDEVGISMPFVLKGNTSQSAYDNGTTLGRIARLLDQGTSGAFYDFGIDVNGNLFINSSQSTGTLGPILVISPTGALTINPAGLTTAPSGTNTTDVVVDQNGTLYVQSALSNLS